MTHVDTDLWSGLTELDVEISHVAGAFKHVFLCVVRPAAAGLQAQQGEDTGPGDTVEDALQTALHAGAANQIV